MVAVLDSVEGVPVWKVYLVHLVLVEVCELDCCGVYFPLVDSVWVASTSVVIFRLLCLFGETSWAV